MLVSCPTELLDSLLGGVDKAIEMLAKAGFDAYDFSLCEMQDDHWLMREDWREKAANLRAVADKCSIVCNQSHAPFPSSVGDSEKDAAIFKRIVRSMEAAAILGAKIIIVHPKQHLRYAENAKELFEMNMEFYKSLIPYCEKFGIKIAIENMWQMNRLANHPIASTCSGAKEFCEYIDTLNSEWIVGCLDIGHVSLMGTDICEFIKTMGKDRIKALHVHDTDYVHDLHTLPYLHKIDYEKVADALREIGYDGDITFEANSFYRKLPNQLIPQGARFMCEVGKHLANKVSQK